MDSRKERTLRELLRLRQVTGPRKKCSSRGKAISQFKTT
jgi:hypothetical protein